MKDYKYRTTFTYNGKRYSVYADSKADLYEKRARKLLELENDSKILSPSTTVSEWTKEALTTYKSSVSPKVMETMKYRIDKYILSEIGSLPVSKVRPVQCQEILNAAAGMSQSQVKKLSQELHFIFETAKENDLIKKNPADKLVKPKCYAGSRQALTAYETKVFLKVAEDPKYKLFLLMYYCGCRPSEAMEARGNDIQEKDGIMVLHIRGTKTVNSDRYVPIPDALLPKITGTGAFAPISPNNSGRKHSRSSYVRLVASLRRGMNIEMGCKTYRNALVPPYPLRSSFVPYDLRHTYCTNLAKAGVDIRVAQKLMGHADISITSRIYTHIDDEYAVKDAAARIGCSEKKVATNLKLICD